MIDLEKIIDSQITFNADLQSRDEIKDCMKEAIQQALEVASEEAECWVTIDSWADVHKASILKVMEKVK